MPWMFFAFWSKDHAGNAELTGKAGIQTSGIGGQLGVRRARRRWPLGRVERRDGPGLEARVLLSIRAR